MTNVLKQSRANRCKVLVDFSGKEIRISVEDNGKGMLTRPGHKPGIGMASIRGNINLLGGTVEVSSHKNKDMAINISNP